jgi:acyl-CoA synthetase (AMP-forming)/AMP-acid ligase II
VLYSKLLKVASQQGDRMIVDDRSRNTQFGYLDILHGTATLKHQLLDLIEPSTLAKPGEFFIAILAPNGYEFIVGVLATLAIGGVVVPVREFPQSIAQSLRPQQLTLRRKTKPSEPYPPKYPTSSATVKPKSSSSAPKNTTSPNKSTPNPPSPPSQSKAKPPTQPRSHP